MDVLPMTGQPDADAALDTYATEECHMPGTAVAHKHVMKSSDQPGTESGNGYYHACGHDGHTAMMLIVAHWIENNQQLVRRKVVIFFQPSEESRRKSDNRSSAQVVVEDGLFDIHPDIHAVYAVHGGPGMPVGNFLISTSAIMAGSGRFSIMIHGTGGHAANPGRAQTEPLLAASAIITCGQTIISRRFEPQKSGVLAFCVVDGLGSTAGNVCPSAVEVRGSIRAFSDDDWNYISAELERISTHIALAYKCTAVYVGNKGYPVTENSPNGGEITFNAAAAVLKDEEGLNTYRVGYGVGEFPPATGSEDFSYLLQRRPGAFSFLSIGEDFHSLHTPEVKFAAEALKYGGRYFAELVLGPDCTDPIPT